jgi:hypothetical protein
MTEELEVGFEALAQPSRRKHGKLLASVAAAVVLAAGGAVTYVALAADDHGASTPRQAVQHLIADLEHADLVGVLDDLVPGERGALSGPVRQDVASLKRLGVLTSTADPAAVSGMSFETHNLTYGSDTVEVNAHVQIVQITGGSVDVGVHADALPFTHRFLAAADAPTTNQTQHVAITHPVRIATEKVGSGWYPSLFYTIADAASHHTVPAAGDYIPAAGAGSPESAVQAMVSSLVSGDVRSALAVISPAELGAVHDYGGLIVDAAGSARRPALTVKTLDLTSTSIPGGSRVRLKTLAVSSGGREFRLALHNGCAVVDAGLLHQRVCAADVANLISTFVGSLRCRSGFSYGSTSYAPLGRLPGCHGPQFSAAQQRAITDLVSGLLSGGVDTAQIGGKWFVAPVRTVADLGSSVLGALKGDDLFQLATLGK